MVQPIIKNIYTDKILKYPLDENDCNNLENVWKFVELFNYRTIYLHQYRKHVIEEVNKRYSIDEFLLYENILNKLFWNLRWMLFPFWDKENLSRKQYYEIIQNNYGENKNIPKYVLQCEKKKYATNRELMSIIKKEKIDKLYYRSFVNKLFVIDEKNREIYLKKMEGSVHIFNKNFFNLLTSTITTNKILYEGIMKDPFCLNTKLDNICLPEFFYEFDYPFPNLNQCIYDTGNDDCHKYKIQKMYYDDNAEGNWFKIIRCKTMLVTNFV